MAAVQDPTQMALLAVNALFTNPDKEEKKRANEWLSEFQHTVSTQLYMPSSACKKKEETATSCLLLQAEWAGKAS
jgi:hypothetical protein